ncbi:hypothetical protein BV210_01180 [Halorientalis sp. IM1011]|nr:hypothetical protein BV210_01180 [Halorientalis sp. IM1011]
MVGLVFGLLVISGVLFALGGLLATGGELTVQGSLLAFGQPAMLAAGGFFGLAGVVVLYAGSVGLVHKLIADSVTAGFENAEGTATGPVSVSEDTASTRAEQTAESPSESGTTTTFDRDERAQEEPIAADSSAAEPVVDEGDPAGESVAEGTGSEIDPDTGKVEPESVDLVDEPTQKPGQSRSSSEPAEDAVEDSVADPGPEPDQAGSSDDRDETGGTGRTDGQDTEPVAFEPEDGAEAISTAPESTEEEGVEPVAAESATDDDPSAPADIDRAVTEATGTSLDESDDVSTEPVGSDETAAETAEPTEVTDDPIERAGEPAVEGDNGASGTDDDAVSGATDDTGTDETDDPFTEPAVDVDEESSETEKADVIDRAFEQEEDADIDADTVIDDAIEAGEVEDTSDEPGDWEPLDESDLKDD